MSFFKKIQKKYSVTSDRSLQEQRKELVMPHSVAMMGKWKKDDINSYYWELDRYRRHDHGGGNNGDGWLDSEEIDKDFNEGAWTYRHKLDAVNKALEAEGFKPNAQFNLGEKGHFSIEVNLQPV